MKGIEVPGQTIGQQLSEIIGRETKGKSLKLYGWHQTLKVGDPLVLDDADKKDLENLIEEHPEILVFAKGQMLEIIANSK